MSTCLFLPNWATEEPADGSDSSLSGREETRSTGGRGGEIGGSRRGADGVHEKNIGEEVKGGSECGRKGGEEISRTGIKARGIKKESQWDLWGGGDIQS